MSNKILSTAQLEFFSELEEILQRISENLSFLEKQGFKQEKIDSFYREIHTIKGSSLLFGYTSIGNIAHAIEAILEPIRNSKVQLAPGLLQPLFAACDSIEKISVHLKENPQGNSEHLKEAEVTVTRLIDSSNRIFNSEMRSNKDVFGHLNESKLFFEGKKEVMQAPAEAKAKIISNKEELNPNNFEVTTIRVQVPVLDRLMNLASEMVLVRNQVMQFSQKSDDYNFQNLSKKLDLVTTELQDEVMKTRMQPVGSILSKFNRVIRDLAKDLGKQIDLTLEGAETELDKTLIEAIKDPLTHIIRNSCDHGIELPDVRIKKNKPPTGNISVKSFQESGHVIIEIKDDGGGLNTEKIKAKAVEKNIVSKEKFDLMSEAEVFNLIFAPGFSTAQQVSSVSGRGVGMDVVKTNIEKIGGRVSITSQLDVGTTMRLQIPLTLAIVPALLVETDGSVFCIPQIKLVELVRYEIDSQYTRIESISGKPILRIRGKLMPLISLNECLNNDKKIDYRSQHNINIAILSNDKNVFGLIVDRILDTNDIVVKSIASFLKKIQVFSGATVLGDGSVSLILDTAGILKKENFDQNIEQDLLNINPSNKFEQINEIQEFLSFSLGRPGQFVVPLCLVHRLEVFDKELIQISGKHQVVQYRNTVMPIISVDNYLGGSGIHDSEGDEFSIIVVEKRGNYYGLQVSGINDVITSSEQIIQSVQMLNGVLGSLIIDKKIITVIDILKIIDDSFGSSEFEISKKSHNSLKSGSFKKLNILFAEDTNFFANFVCKILRENGHDVMRVSDGSQAWEVLNNSNQNFDLLLSDIEMPNLNGFELAKKIKESGQFAHMKMIALTTRFKSEDKKNGFNSGFDHYLEKLKADELLEALNLITQGGHVASA